MEAVRGPVVLGRVDEFSVLDAAVAAARSASTTIVVVHGPAGVGKTSLLDGLRDRSEGFLRLHARGSEFDADVSFAGLTQLVHPIRDRIDGLADVPRATLQGALALGPPSPADQFGVGVALMQLLSHVADDTPVLVVVDDVGWLDDVSRSVIAFALRRLESEPVLGVFAGRERPELGLRGAVELALGGLDEDAGVELLKGRHRWRTEPARRLWQRCGGNPLALVEVGDRLSARQRAGLDPYEDRLPLGHATADLFRPQIERLDQGGRFALLAAALCAEPTATVVRSACAAAGWPGADLGGAEESGLVRLEADGVRFRHPLARSGVSELATPGAHRAAHAALAEVVDDPARRAWHRAASLVEPDEPAAATLMDVAMASAARADLAAAFRAAERAAALTPDPAAAAVRHLAAAQFALLAGIRPDDQVRRAVAVGDAAIEAQAMIVLAARGTMWGDTEVLEQARNELPSLVAVERHAAAIVMAYAAMNEWYRLDVGAAANAAAEAWELADHRLDLSHPFGFIAGMAVATISLQAGRDDAGLVDACYRLRRDHPTATQPLTLSFLMRGEVERAWATAREGHGWAAERGDVASASWAAVAAGMAAHRLGETRQAVTWLEQAVDIAWSINVMAEGLAMAELAVVRARRGELESAVKLAEQVLAFDRHVDPTRCIAEFALGLAAVGRGDLDEGVERMRRLPAGWPVMVEHWPATFELVDVLVRAGRVDEARALEPTLAAIEQFAVGDFRGPVLRCRALLAEGAAAWPIFREATQVAGAGARRLELARARLCFGERLAAAGEHAAAAPELVAALEVFDEQECAPWAGRARVALELGGTMTQPTPEVSPMLRLTPAEEQVALSVAMGRTNREIATELFVSVKTVETHLTRIYRKLEIRSRTELAVLQLR